MDKNQIVSKIKERKQAKLKIEGREKYNAKNTEVKRSAREERRNWLEKRAAREEKAAEKGRNYSRSCSASPSQ